MAKRRLSKQQRSRIRQNQRAFAEQGNDLKRGLVIAHYGNEVELVDLPSGDRACGGPRRCKLRANLPLVVCGDRVAWREAGIDSSNDVVEALMPRDTTIARPRPHDAAKPIAANVDLILLVFAVEPAPVANLIDRYLIAAENAGIPVALLVNKTDLLDSTAITSEQKLEISELAALYRQLGYKVFYFSAPGAGQWEETVPAARFDATQVLAGKTAILVGQSGVGKSSIINALDQGANALTGDISSANTRGRHTTTSSRLYFIDSGPGEQHSAIIDSPGIREFALWHLDEADIIDGMPEFRERVMHCRFRDCEHGVSEGCALQEAINNKEIHPSRVSSYRHILASNQEYQ